MDHPWSHTPVTEDSPIDQADTFSNEPPLEFAALFAQSQPENGKVSLSQLGGILNKALLPNDKMAQIIEYCADVDDANMVSEAVFYWALHQAACIQENDLHIVSTYDEDEAQSFGKELKLHDVPSAMEHATTEPVPDYDPTAEPRIRVAVSTKDAGSYLFRHALYSVNGEFDEKTVKVLRRYRDFATLADFLSRKYTFRVIPVLPPKRITVNGRYLVGGDQDSFLAQRAAGLARFINLVTQHPILSRDKMVGEFLFELAYNPIKPLINETDGKVPDPLFTSQWSPESIKHWSSIEIATEDFLSQIVTMCLLGEKELKRLESKQRDAQALSQSFTAMSNRLYDVYPSMQEDLPAIHQRLNDGSQFADADFENTFTSRDDLINGPLKELKLYRDMLLSILELFKRIKLLGGNNIPDLKKKIAATQRKLAAASTREDAKEDDLHKWRMIIQTSQNSIRELTNRDWQIKLIVSQELQMVQSMQYQLSKFLRSIAMILSDGLARKAEYTNTFTESAESAPLKS